MRARLELGIGLGEREERVQRVGEMALVLAVVGPRAGCTACGAPRSGHVDEHSLLVARVALHGLDEVGHEVVAAPQLGVDVGPRVRHERGLRREPVVRDGDQEPDRDEDGEADPDHVHRAGHIS